LVAQVKYNNNKKASTEYLANAAITWTSVQVKPSRETSTFTITDSQLYKYGYAINTNRNEHGPIFHTYLQFKPLTDIILHKFRALPKNSKLT
jgi:hypothetical protein